MEQLIISLVSGALGGNVAGSILKNFNMGFLGNSIAGLVGGGIGGKILSAVSGGSMGEMASGAAEAAGGMDFGAIAGQVASGGLGGGVVLVIAGTLKKMMSK